MRYSSISVGTIWLILSLVLTPQAIANNSKNKHQHSEQVKSLKKEKRSKSAKCFEQAKKKHHSLEDVVKATNECRAKHIKNT